MNSRRPERAVILAPFGRDAEVASSLLAEKGIASIACVSVQALVEAINEGAGFAILTEEALNSADLRGLSALIEAQPEWSDFPFVLLTRRERGIERNPAAARLLETLGNVTFIERPFHPTTLISAARAAIRARRRQYEARARLDALRELNETLESRIAAAVAECRQTEEELRQAQKLEAIGQLTGGVAHDFNNLLMAISSGLTLLDKEGQDSAYRAQVNQAMRRAVERGAALTRQLLAFSRRRPLEPQPLDLAESLAGMRALLDRSLRGDVQMRFNLDPDLWRVEVDPGEFELAILNLCVNARDAMPAGGMIEISAQNDPGSDSVTLTVADRGAGMSKDVVAHAFEPFFTTKDLGKGSGLGLAQVYAFVTRSGGAVTIDSEPGRGTKVILSFPRCSEQPESGPAATVPPTVEVASKSEGRVLLVEDDAEVAALTRDLLGSMGYSITHVDSASAALGALSNGRVIDVVFSDVMMPGGMSGVELAREVRRRRPAQPIVLTTGFIEAARDALAEGFDVLIKPYQPQALRQAIERARSRSG